MSKIETTFYVSLNRVKNFELELRLTLTPIIRDIISHKIYNIAVLQSVDAYGIFIALLTAYDRHCKSINVCQNKI